MEFNAQSQKSTELKKKELHKLVDSIRHELIELQQEVRYASFPVIVLFEGIDGAGKHETCDDLYEWMDPRWLKTRAYDKPTEEDLMHPRYWRFWRDLPADGEISLFLHAWTSLPLFKKTRRILSEDQFQERLIGINNFEKTLQQNGALIIKFFFNLNHEQQHQRLVKLSSDDLLAWKINPTDWEQLELYDQYVIASKKLIASSQQPWFMVDGSDEKNRSIQIAKIIIKSIRTRLKHDKETSRKQKTSILKLCPKANRLGAVDLSQKIEKEVYNQKLKELQSEISSLQRIAYKNKIPSIFVFEGWDAAGKGGAIRRLMRALDSRQYEVIPIAAPTKLELSKHYLHRFWTRIPRAGRIAVFDRSWYGRVLVERIESFATQEEWRQAYDEINDFESQFIDYGGIVCKFWLHISPEEQLKRFVDRKHIPHKTWKLSEEDWRNRKKWPEYLNAVEDMFELTSKPVPWQIIPANQKQFARINVLEIISSAYKKRLENYLPKP